MTNKPPAPNLNDIIKRTQQMQETLQKIQKEVAITNIEGEAGGGMVTVYLTGNYHCKETVLNPDLLAEDIQVIQDLITAAFNDAVFKNERNLRQKMGDFSGFKLPDNLEDEK